MDKLPFRQVHLDFHTSECLKGVGSRFQKKQFQDALQTGHVNSITLFSKCHHGWTYHPTKAGVMHPHLRFDLLGSMLDACREIGVAAPVYLSAGFDEQYVKKHPDHAFRWSMEDPGPDFSKPMYHLLCMNSPYLAVLTEQVREVVQTYHPVGIFLDIVAPRACFCPYCKQLLIQAERNAQDPAEYEKLGEQTYLHYTQVIQRAAKEIDPDIRIFHNGGHIAAGRRDLAFANTHLELESLPTGGWGYDHFPKSARYVQGLGLEYLGMTGKFHKSWGEFGGYKHPNALRYEAALSLANGAKCSIGDQMHPYGFLDPATYALIGTAYAEVEQKEPWCTDVVPIADIGLLSAEGYVGGRNVLPDIGACRILLEGHYLFDVLDEQSDFSNYKILILPDCIPISKQLLDQLTSFVGQGGKLLCTGKSGVEDGVGMLFDLGAEWKGPNEIRPDYFVPRFQPGALHPAAFVLYAQGYLVQATERATVHGDRQNSFFNRTAEHFCSHQHTPNQVDGSLPAMTEGLNGIYVAWDLFTEYAETGSLIAKEIAKYALDTLLDNQKTLETDLPAQGVATLMRQKDRHILHMLYASPVKRGKDIEVIEDVVPLHDIHITLRLPTPPRRVKLVPQNEPIQYQIQQDGAATFSIDRLECHQMVEID